MDLGHENGGVQGLISYMRTDSLRISGEAMDAAKSYICEKYGEKYYPAQPRVYKAKNNAQDAHEAIRPSNMKFEPEAIKKYLTPDQFKLYRLIWNRFLASQMQSAELDTITAELEAGGYLFHTSGYTVKFKGYMTVYEESEEESASSPKDDTPQKSTKLPALAEGDVLSLIKILPAQHFTEPPPRYTDATLIKFLEEKGIGRPEHVYADHNEYYCARICHARGKGVEADAARRSDQPTDDGAFSEHCRLCIYGENGNAARRGGARRGNHGTDTG